jgi:hypothetical protein
MKYSVILVHVTRFKSGFAVFVGIVFPPYLSNNPEIYLIRTIVTLLLGLTGVLSVWNSPIPCSNKNMAGVRTCEVGARQAIESIGSYNDKISFKNMINLMCMERNKTAGW